MSHDYEIVDFPPENYYVDCHQCGVQYNASLAGWCSCESGARSVTCPRCSTCSCKTPAAFKANLWENAPRALRENTNRFRLGDGETAIPAIVPLRAPHVLIVDDEEDMRSLVACYVEQMGYAVTAVSSPIEALDLVSTTPFQLVITDALMPQMDGRKLCQKLKDLYGDAIKVIVMTSLYTASRYKTEARYTFKADDYLAKPLKFGVLKTAMDRLAPIAL